MGFLILLLAIPAFFVLLYRTYIIFCGSPKAQIALRIKMKKEQKCFEKHDF